MPIYQQGIGDIPRDDTSLIDIDIVYVIDDVDSFSLGSISWLDDPNVLLMIVLLELLVVSVEVSKFIRKDIRIRDEVEILLSILFLHSNNVEAQSIFSSNLIALRKVIDLLIFVKPFIEV